MSLLNYSTRIDALKTVGEIQKLLAKAGASAILQDYDGDGNITALSFKIAINDQTISFRLPTDWHPVLEVLKQDPRVANNLCTKEQAIRVAWRITKDWVEAQLAFIETMMVTTAQVFLPYAITSSGQTMYEYISNNSHLLLGDGQ